MGLSVEVENARVKCSAALHAGQYLDASNFVSTRANAAWRRHPQIAKGDEKRILPGLLRD